MKYSSLQSLINTIQSSPRVKGIFVTGSTAKKILSMSDIDLVIILDINSENIRSIYATIENHFADVFFFDVSFLKRLGTKSTFAGNDFEGMFMTWLTKGKISYDPDNLLKKLRDKLDHQSPTLTVSKQEQQDLWVKVNYNYIANTRYFQSGHSLYHQALELRLFYSVVELITAYFSFRCIPWRGEKAAIEHLQQQDPDYLKLFQAVITSPNLDQKMKSYNDLFQYTFYGEYKQWDKDFVIPIDTQIHYNKNLGTFWDSLLEKEKSE